MPDHDLHRFMAQITAEMESEYGRIYARAAEDPGTAGDESEENWARLLKEWLPLTYHVEAKGRLIGLMVGCRRRSTSLFRSLPTQGSYFRKKSG